MSNTFRNLGAEIGALVEAKQKQYGDSAGKTGRILQILYPNGIPVHAYDDALLIVRCLDKFSRIAQRGEDGKDLGGESPYRDLAGYGLLGWAKDEVFESEELPEEVIAEQGPFAVPEYRVRVFNGDELLADERGVFHTFQSARLWARAVHLMCRARLERDAKPDEQVKSPILRLSLIDRRFVPAKETELE